MSTLIMYFVESMVANQPWQTREIDIPWTARQS